MRVKLTLIVSAILKVLYASAIAWFVSHLLGGISAFDAIGIFAIVYLKEFITIKVEVKDE